MGKESRREDSERWCERGKVIDEESWLDLLPNDRFTQRGDFVERGKAGDNPREMKICKGRLDLSGNTNI